MISTKINQAVSSSSFSTMRETSTEANNLAAVSTVPQTQPQSLTSIDSPAISTPQQPTTSIGSTAPQTQQPPSTSMNSSVSQTQPQSFTSIDSKATDVVKTSVTAGNTVPPTDLVALNQSEYTLKKGENMQMFHTTCNLRRSSESIPSPHIVMFVSLKRASLH